MTRAPNLQRVGTMVREGTIPPEQWNELRRVVEQIIRDQITTSGVLKHHLPLSVGMFRFVSTTNVDYIIAQRFNGTANYGVNIAIAKPFILRPSNTSRTIGGVSFTYSYNANGQQRTSTNTGDSSTEEQTITPYYNVDDVIFAARSRNKTDTVTGAVIGEQASGEEIEWVDLNVDARMWSEDPA